MNKDKTLHCLLFFLCIAFTALGQQKYTPYDNIPSLNRLDKPSYSITYPECAKMLYQYPVNYYEVVGKFEAYLESNPKAKSPFVRYYKNWKRQIEPYVLSDGTIKLPEFTNLFNEDNTTKSIKVNAAHKAIEDNSNWSFYGPKQTVFRNTGSNSNAGESAPWQTNIFSLDVSKSNPDIIYCGSETGFVNKSTDNGMTWELCAPDYKFGSGILAVAIDHINPDVVYVSANGRIHKTIDGGKNWFSSAIINASRLIMDATNHNKIIAAASGGIYISTNSGLTWSQSYSLPTWDVAIKPNDPNVIYGISSSGDYFDLVISNDGGVTFSKDTNFPSNLLEKSGGLLAVTPDNPEIVLLAMLSGDNEAQTNFPLIYKGVNNNGSYSWAQICKGFVRQSGGGLSGDQMSNGQGYYDFVFEVAPDNENIVFWGTTSFYKSTDGGYNYTKVGGYGASFNIHPDMQDITMLGDGKMWLSTDGGMNYSTDYFTSLDNWSPRLEGLHGSDMWGFDQGWNDDVIVGGRYHNGNTTLADTYNNKALRMGGGESPTGWIIHGLPRQAVFKDLNGGSTTISLPLTVDQYIADNQYPYSKLPNNTVQARGNLLEHPNYSSVLYVGEGNGFWKSEDFGASWELLYDFGGTVRFIEISHKDPNIVYADVEGQGFFQSKDGGYTWTAKNNGILSSWFGKLHFVISPYDANTVYLCVQKSNFSYEGKILKTTNGGNTWTDWSGTLATSKFTKMLAIQPTTGNEDLVYMFTKAHNSSMTEIGEVFYRRGESGDWETFSNVNDYPVNMKPIFAQVFFRDSKIRVAGNDGVWESPLVETNFQVPYITPWIGASTACTTDVVRLDDHSMINHENVVWEWSIVPAPQSISNANIRNPEVIFGSEGTYSITLKATKNGEEYLSEPVSITVEDCELASICEDIEALVRYNFENSIDNDGTLGSIADLELDTQSTNTGGTSFTSGKYGNAYNFDGTNTLTTNASTGWLGITGDAPRTVSAWIYIPSSNLGRNFPILDMGVKSGGSRYTLKVNTNNNLRLEVEGGGINSSSTITGDEWIHVAATFNASGTPDLEDVVLYINGENVNPTAMPSNSVFTKESVVLVGAQTGNGGPVFPSIGKIDDLRVYDCALTEQQVNRVMQGITLSTQKFDTTSVKAFPMPAYNTLNITVPGEGAVQYVIYSAQGQVVRKGDSMSTNKTHELDLSTLNSGLYFIQMENSYGVTYRLKVLKK